MTVGNVSNINYIAAAGRVSSPLMRQPAQGISPSSPATRPVQGSNNLFVSLDGDRAEISDRARGLSILNSGQRPVSPGTVSNYQFNLPGSIIGWGAADSNPTIVPQGASLPGAVPSQGSPGSSPLGPMLPESANDAMLEALEPQGSCYTCDNRRYVDQSDDASVSFQTPTNISPNMAAAAVAAHENEHVRNEQARAQREDREIVNQTVTLHYDTCPECGKHYVSGGTTRTTSISKSDSGNMFDADLSSEGEM